MPRARARQIFSSGLGFGLETQKPGLGLGLGLETCWTRTRTRVLRIWTRTRTRTRVMRTRTRLGLEETRTRCISEGIPYAPPWHISQTNLNKLERIQNSLARVITTLQNINTSHLHSKNYTGFLSNKESITKSVISHTKHLKITYISLQ